MWDWIFPVWDWTSAFGSSTLAKLLANGAFIASVVVGLWTLWRFSLSQERYPHIEPSADMSFIGIHGNAWIVELIAYIDNKGFAQHKMQLFTFKLEALEVDENLTKHGELRFPKQLKQGTFTKGYEYFVVNPKIKAKYSFVTAIPENVAFVRFTCQFKYMDRRQFFHEFECTKEVPRIPSKPS
ncbi:hypothetical protein [Bradyrhizobium sp. RDT46]|uniref:hypothetical protein n=1 Tax=Bradyrhizobium sp. RDT46 TaxID=3341829 RepID=UPI0035C77698